MGDYFELNHLMFPAEYDVLKLQAELRTIVSKGWHSQKPFSTANIPTLTTTVYHDGSWKIISLRSLGGHSDRTDPGGPGMEDYSYTSYIEGAPYIKSILDQFGGYLRTARLSILNPGEKIEAHSDTYLAFRYGQVRLHIPIITNDCVEITIGGEVAYWEPGRLWYGDFSKSHSVVNNGECSRIHLILDVYVHQKLLSMFTGSGIGNLPLEEVLVHKDEVAVSNDCLKRLECHFFISAGLLKGVFEFDDGICGEYSGKIELFQNRLSLFLDNVPIFALVPISQNEFRLLGWSMERIFVFRYCEDRVVELSIRMNCGSRYTRIDLPLSMDRDGAGAQYK